MFKIDEEQVVQLQLKVSTLLAAIKQPQSASVNATEGVSLSSVGVERKARTPKTLSNRRLYAQGVPLYGGYTHARTNFYYLGFTT